MVHRRRLPSGSSLSSSRLPPNPLAAAHRWLLLSLAASYLTTVGAEANVTVDDGDRRIAYSPPGAWSRSVEMDALDYGGSHMLTQHPNATAVFNFTGVAVYFLAPLWPRRANTAISLDASPATLVELVDRSRPEDNGQGPETAPFRVVWNATGLANAPHSLRISVGAGQPSAIVDGLIYTDPSASRSAAPAPAATASDASPSSSSPSSPSSVKNRAVPIAVGTLFGVLAILIVLGALWYFFWKKRSAVSETWTVEGQSGGRGRGRGGESFPNNGHPTDGANNGYYGYGYYGAPPPSAYMGYPPLQPVPASWGPPYPHPHAAYGAPYGGDVGAPNRAPNRYQPGYTLSTITEKSTPQIGEARTMPGTPLSAAAATAAAVAFGAHSPPTSLQSEMGYYTAPGSSVGQYSPPPAGLPHAPSDSPSLRNEKVISQSQKTETTLRR